MLGANLRQLSRQAASISALCRDLGINRTQYNRYLAGESFPRPDVLHRICAYFGVDARILLEPVEQIQRSDHGSLDNPAISDFMSGTPQDLPEDDFPSGFYRFLRRSFLDDAQFVQGLVYVKRVDGNAFLRGFEARGLIRQQGLPLTPDTREFRGALLAQDDGVAAVVSRKGGKTATFNFLARVPALQNNLWVGYVTRAVRENVAGRRVERLIYEYLGRDTHKVLQAARATGFCRSEDLSPYHRNLLKVDEPFA